MNTVCEHSIATPMLMMFDPRSLPFYAILCLVPLFGFAWAFILLDDKRFKVQRRTTLLLDLLETAAKQGRSPIDAISSLAAMRDPMVGDDFSQLASHLRSGLSLAESLSKTRSMVHPQIVAVLAVGEEAGVVTPVIPACRRLLKDVSSSLTASLDSLLFALVSVGLVAATIFSVINSLIVPKFNEIVTGLITQPMGISSPCSGPVWNTALILAWIQFGVVAAFLTALFLDNKVLSVRFSVTRSSKPFIASTESSEAWISLVLPWREKRLRRDFTAMLATLLDAGMPEPKAVELAAKSTGNSRFMRRAELALQSMRDGNTLAKAMQAFDSTGEFHWRLGVACRNKDGFLAALSGWVEALDAKAWQQQQTAAQTLVILLVCLNGAMVALTTKTLFGALISIIEGGVLW